MRDEWYVARRGQDGNKRYGPVPLRQLRELVDTGKVKPEDLVWREGMGNWQRADQCDEIAPPREPRREPRDYPPDDRRGSGYDRGSRGPRPDDDDRPFPRRYPPPRQSSGGWVVPLVIGGAVVGVCFLGCAGLVGYAMFNSGGPPAYTTAYTPRAVTTFAKPADQPEIDGEYGALYTPPPFNRPDGFEHEIPYNGSLLYYTDNVTQDDAQALGVHLSDRGEFQDDHPITVQLDKDALTGNYQVRFCVKPGLAWNENAADYYRSIRTDLADSVFQGSLVEVHLCDGNMNTMRVIGPKD